jgi:hypothetical protein
MERSPRARRLVFAATLAPVVVVLAAAGCGGSGGSGGSKDSSKYTASAASTPAKDAPPWPAPPNPLALARKAGLKPERREQLAYHVHAHLDVFVNGKPVTVPAGIGINIKDPGVESGPDPATGGKSYGGIKLCAEPCISPLHTHDATGVLHTESATPTPNRLGQFFIEWGVRLDQSCVGGYCSPQAPIAFFLDGKRYSGDPRQIGLKNHLEIAVVIGSPPSKIPDFSSLV